MLPNGFLRVKIRNKIIDLVSVCPERPHHSDRLIRRLVFARCSKFRNKTHRIFQQRQIRFDLLLRPVPPLDLLQRTNRLLIKSIFNDARRIPHHNGIRRHVLRNDGARADHRTVADTHTAEDRHVTSDPNVISDDDLLAIHMIVMIYLRLFAVRQILKRIR